MKVNVYTVHDSKASAYLQPFFQINDNTAIRAFSYLVNKDDHEFGMNPQDYALFKIGTWDDSECILSVDNKKAIHNGVELLRGNTNEISDDPSIQQGTPS